MKIYRLSQMDFLSKLESLKMEMAQAAQQAYDQWEQDDEGMDAELGSGGICQDIASEICSVLSSHGINCSTLSAEIGEQHVWTIAWENEEKSDEYDEYVGYNGYHIDIHPSSYETGGGYNWSKIPDVVFTPYLIDISGADDETVEYLINEN